MRAFNPLLVTGFLACFLVCFLVIAPARADLAIKIDKSTQQMTVTADGEQLYSWPVSTGVAGHDTPAGEFKPFRMEKDHYSVEWDDAPMPYSIFFTMKGHAIHGTNHRGLGHPASHGCVRLSVQNAATLWDLVKKHKMANTTVVLTGEIPAGARAPAVARAKPRLAPRNAQLAPRDDRLVPRDDQDDNVVGSADPREPNWRGYDDGPRYYYYRERAYYPPQRRSYGGFP